MLNIQFGEFPVLQTQRLLLRQIVQSDAADFFTIRRNADVMRYLDRASPENITEVEAWIKTIEDGFINNESVSWAICLPGSNQVIGNISLWRMDKPNHRAEIGYMVLPEFWGKGFGTEAICAVLYYAFQVLNFHSIEANVNPLNEASKKLLQKAGFVQEAYFRENYHFNGRFLDSAIFSLLKNDFIKIDG